MTTLILDCGELELKEANNGRCDLNADFFIGSDQNPGHHTSKELQHRVKRNRPKV